MLMFTVSLYSFTVIERRQQLAA